MKPAPLAELTCTTFAGLLQSCFKVHGSGLSPVEIVLVEATPHPASREKTQAADGNFSLVFTGTLDRFLPQRTYQIEHENLGAFDLFIVPIGKEENGFKYEAVFNRPVQSGQQ